MRESKIKKREYLDNEKILVEIKSIFQNFLMILF